LIACFCFPSNISAKYYENPTMLSRVIAKNIWDVFFETQCRMIVLPDAEDRTIVCSFVWTKRLQRDGRTDRRTCRQTDILWLLQRSDAL